jgi:hypothetical protein
VNDTNTDFTITFDTPIQNAYNFEVVSASFPNLFKSFAPYETILYFYHEDFDGGSTAIGVPLSITPAVGGTTGDASVITGREAYIDKRYFADGTDLASYLTGWLQSYSTNFPASSTGLCPFYYANDDPTQPPTFFANQGATGITFSNLSFTYDDLTSNGTLKLTFADSGVKTIRVASVLDFGSLTAGYRYPSQLGYKIGYTAFEYEAFSSGTGVVQIRSPNNKFFYYAGSSANNTTITIPENDYSPDGLAAQLQTLMTGALPFGNPSVAVVINAGKLEFTFGNNGTTTGFVGTNIAFDPSTDILKAQLGFNPAVYTFQVANSGGVITTTNNPTTNSTAPTPADHIAPDTINLIRTASVYVASSLSSGESLASAGRKDILFVIPLTAGIGDVQLYQSSLSGIVINRPPAAIRNLRITFLDDNFQTMEPLPGNASVSVEIHFAYDDDAKVNQRDSVSTNLYA